MKKLKLKNILSWQLEVFRLALSCVLFLSAAKSILDEPNNEKDYSCDRVTDTISSDISQDQIVFNNVEAYFLWNSVVLK